MDVTASNARRSVAPLLSAIAGLALLASAFYAAILAHDPLVAAVAGASGLAALRAAFCGAPIFKCVDRVRRGGVRALRLYAQ